jgi:hypothetical protein
LVTIAYLTGSVPDGEFENIQPLVDADLSFLPRFCDGFKLVKKGAKPGRASWSSILSSAGREDVDLSVAANWPIPKTVKALLGGAVNGWVQISPLSEGTESPLVSANANECGNVYVFVIGPGSYPESIGVMKVGQKKNVTYGCTSIPRPEEFMHQFTQIGSRP